jgi:parvulin-like peptidyl-prolyl isomerase
LEDKDLGINQDNEVTEESVTEANSPAENTETEAENATEEVYDQLFQPVAEVQKKHSVLPYILLIVAAVAAIAFGFWWSTSTGWVAKVNDGKVSTAAFENRVRLLMLFGGMEVDPDQYKGEVLNQLIDEEIMLQEAAKRGVKVDEKKFLADFAMFEEQISAMFGGPEAYKAELSRVGITSSDIKEAFYVQFVQEGLLKDMVKDLTLTPEEVAAAQEQYAGYREIQASHILVATEAEAKDVIAKLAAGADLAELAKEVSLDPTAADNGGDLGFFGPGMMDPAFDEAAFALKKGETSAPVQSSFGFHVIKIIDEHGPDYMALQMKKLYNQEEQMTKLRKDAVIEKLPDDKLPTFSDLKIAPPAGQEDAQ